MRGTLLLRSRFAGQWLLAALVCVSLCACRHLPQRDGSSEVHTGGAAAFGVSMHDDAARTATPAIAAGEAPGNQVSSSAAAQVTYLAPAQGDLPGSTAQVQHTAMAPPMPYQATYSGGEAMLPGYAAAPAGDGAGCRSCLGGCCPPTPWRPDGIECPWPADEYLCDGEDDSPHVKIGPDFSVRGLQAEDTVVHFDTLAGDVIVEPSNRVCIYAPRFAAVRQVSGILSHAERQKPGGVELPTRLVQEDELQIASTVLQPVQPVQDIGDRAVVIFRERLRGVGLDNREGLHEYAGELLPYEDFQVIRNGVMLNSEKARLAISAEAAQTWAIEQAVQVVIDETEVAVERNAYAPGELTTYDHEGNPQMRLVKLASRCDAVPGEIVEFTLRFDNVGDEPVGNVTLLDNLTTRLEYVPESTTCTLDAEFYATENESDSLTLRWEIIDPLPPGQGGVIHFKCRVR